MCCCGVCKHICNIVLVVWCAAGFVCAVVSALFVCVCDDIFFAD